MPAEFDNSERKYPDLSVVPDDVTPEEMARLILGRPIQRDGVDVVVDLEITDQMIANALADVGVDVSFEDDVE